MFFPSHSEVLVSALSKNEVEGRLEKVTKNINFLDIQERTASGYKFNGSFEEDSFSISLLIEKGDSFLPLIKGRFETTPQGCILFLKYSLFPSSVFFLGFWSLITFLLTLFFGMVSKNYLYAIITFSLGLGNYLFAWSYFKRKIGISRKIFFELLNL
ncbi:hypothetical protein [Shivajiella indica]|uniref:Uncharacterized protein n=1 Tax=Shivajiella indica TaxID=872115 RepID=A0ABW5B727_9BACT